mmetsp:Transcript_35984/g.120365  ORF Transcript_35984/g.120365 Transcript_35984/m.120365 type:complete len:317 (-) Transcript_35984:989-1939(-)
MQRTSRRPRIAWARNMDDCGTEFGVWGPGDWARGALMLRQMASAASMAWRRSSKPSYIKPPSTPCLTTPSSDELLAKCPSSRVVLSMCAMPRASTTSAARKKTKLAKHSYTAPQPPDTSAILTGDKAEARRGVCLRRARELNRFLLAARRTPVDEGTDDAVRDEGGALHLLACRRRDGPPLVEPRLDSGVVVGVAVGRHHRSVETRAAQRAHERVGHLSCLWRVEVHLAEERALKQSRVQARAAARPHHLPLLLLAVFGAPHAQEVCDCMLLRAVCVGERRVAPAVGNRMVRAGLVHQEANHLQLPLRGGDVDGAA